MSMLKSPILIIGQSKGNVLKILFKMELKLNTLGLGGL
jgi:hypothetical protein